MTKDEVSAFLNGVRADQDMDLSLLSALTGHHRPYLWKIFRGDVNITVTTLHRLTEALGLYMTFESKEPTLEGALQTFRMSLDRLLKEADSLVEQLRLELLKRATTGTYDQLQEVFGGGDE